MKTDPDRYRDGSQKSEEKLIIETQDIEKIKVAEESPFYEKRSTINDQRSTVNPKPQTSKISALDKIRKQYQGNGSSANGNTNHPLNQQELQSAWNEYVQKLKDIKNSAAQSFELATLRIKDDNCFEAVTSNNIEQKFIEQDRNKLFSFLQEKLQNRLLQFNVVIEEKPGQGSKIDAPLSSKDQFQKMAEQYPLVKELKDRLKLDLDY